MKTGIFGGTFSPVHNGHIIMAESFIKELSLDKLYIIPTFIPPHKTEVDGADSADRLRMLRLAFENTDKAIVSDIEIRRANVSYTVDTLKELSSEGELLLLCGSDMFLTIDKWYQSEEIFRRAVIVLGRREKDSETESALKRQRLMLEEKYGARVLELDFDAFEISSSEIREKIVKDESVDGLVPESVKNYIFSHGLYDSLYTDKTLEKVKKRVSETISPYRFRHTLGVEREVIRLSEIFCPEKTRKLRVAALLHDITKEQGTDKQIELCSLYKIEAGELSVKSPKILHSLTGAYFARTLFGDLIDDEIFYSIYYHTTGKSGMNLSEMILYLADYIEDTRTFDDCVRLRKFFYDGIDTSSGYNEKYIHLLKTLVYSFELTVNALSAEGAHVDKTTLDAMEYLKKELLVQTKRENNV